VLNSEDSSQSQGVDVVTVSMQLDSEEHSTSEKEKLHRLIHSDDIFADDEILRPRGPSKPPMKKLESTHHSDVNCSQDDSLPTVDVVINVEGPKGAPKEEVFDVIPIQDIGTDDKMSLFIVSINV
jgi:hypothetical protein